ncbi:MAG: methyl-accepting chemotaxis protein [Clostridia bacterium]|nr:methyl-accepting chemotaxis protein [Clostridia bacterium]
MSNNTGSTGDRNQIKRGIGFKMILVFAIIIIVPLLIMGYGMFGKSTTILKENSEATAAQLMQQSEVSINNYLKKYEVMVQTMGKNSGFQDTNQLSIPGQRHIIGFDSELKTKFSEDPYKLKMWEILDDAQTLNQELQWVYYGTKNGDMFERPDGEVGDGYDPRKRPWYQAATDAKELIWTEPYADFTTNELVITVANPVYGSGNSLEGVIGMDIKMTEMANEMNALKIGDTGYVFLIDQFMNFMTYSDSKLIGIPVKPDMSTLDEGVKASYLEHQSDFERIAAAIENKAEVVELENGNYAILKTIDRFGWTMVGVINEKEFKSDAYQILRWLMIIGVITLLVALSVSVIFAKGITGEIKQVVGIMDRVRLGDFTVKLESQSKDEIGLLSRYFDETVSHLSQLIKNIQSMSSEVTLSAESLAATSEEASSSADEVARTVEEIARGASEQANDAENSVLIANTLSEKFNDLSQRTEFMIQRTENVVNANAEGMEKVNELKTKTEMAENANNSIENAVSELDENTQSIDAILNTISDIAVQTNLLALNASIEAARAGEHGRGFAVVAEEIRKLAEESSGAADKIRGIVTSIITDSEKTVSQMKIVKQIGSEQTLAVSNVDASFNTISVAVNEIVDEIREIKSAVEGLISDKDKIVDAIGNISAVSEETAAASEEVNASMEQQTLAVENVAQSAEQLKTIAEVLGAELRKFNV